MSQPSKSVALIQRAMSLDLPVILRSILQLLKPPSIFKYALYLLLLLNAKSLPFAWHIRVFRPVIAIRFRHLLVSLRLRLLMMGKSRAKREIAMDQWLESLPMVGADPFKAVITYKSFVGIDDSDFNGHLSNSSYAKTFDAARFKAALAYCPSFLRAGGWIALGATNYHFIREIPMLSNYEVRINLLAWDNKWLFAVGRYVTHRKPKQSRSKASNGDKSVSTPPDTFKASLRTPAVPLDTPAFSPGTSSDALDAMKALSAAQINQAEPDGATLHCLSISQLCFKHGRITVPPGIVFACDGFSVPPSSTSAPAQPYSRSNPPPHWSHVLALRSIQSGGSMKKFVAFLRGGWRDVPESERWWEEALGGEIEEKRMINMEILNGLRTGMEGARGMY